MNNTKLINNIFNINTVNETDVINEVFQFQYENNLVYRQWCNLLKSVNPQSLIPNTQYPFLPISFFKTHKVVCNSFIEQQIFESSGTTQTNNSKHYIKEIEMYKQSFIKAFELTYGNINDWCIIGLLPSYLERNNSSLVFMVDELIKQSNHTKSGFYLYNFENLHSTLCQLELVKQKTMIIGVTFALIDFAQQFKMNLKHTIVLETGGMKGRKKVLLYHRLHS